MLVRVCVCVCVCVCVREREGERERETTMEEGSTSCILLNHLINRRGYAELLSRKRKGKTTEY